MLTDPRSFYCYTHTYTDLCLAHPLETWTPFDIVVNSAYAFLTMPVTYKPTNVVISPFIRYSGTSAYNIYILRLIRYVVAAKRFFLFESSRFRLRADRFHPSLAVGAVRLFEPFCLRYGSSAAFPRIALVARFHPRRIMPSKILLANKSSRRRLNTGSALSSSVSVA